MVALSDDMVMTVGYWVGEGAQFTLFPDGRKPA
jgi:hypothetical protein